MTTKFEMKEIPLPISNSLQSFKQIKQKMQLNGDVHLAQIPDFEMEYLENHWTH